MVVRARKERVAAFDAMGQPRTTYRSGRPIDTSGVLVDDNVVRNAVRYTPAGTGVDVRLSARQDEIAISVRDDGIGIAAEHLPRLFETFSQVVPGLGRGGGLGLGLAIVRGLVSLHGGRVDVKSDGHGRGSEFVVQLQASAPAAALPGNGASTPSCR